MADVFYKSDAQNLLRNKHIVLFGDSNARAIYKDLIFLLNHNKIIDNEDLKRKQERSFCGDKLEKHSKLNRGREYEEARSYEKGNIRVNFYFITRCYNPLLVDMMEDIHLGLREAPDVIFINSTLWDVSRWGPNGVTEFKDNLQKLARLFKSSLPTSTLVIWATALPISSKVRSSLLIKQIDFLQHTLRFDVMEANHFARQVMVAHGFDVLDNHFHMRMQVHRRVRDGVHYFPTAIRLLTNLLLTHIALSWDFPLPDRVDTILLDKTKALCSPNSPSSTPIPTTPQVLSNKNKKKKQLTTEPLRRGKPNKCNKKEDKFDKKFSRTGFPYQRNRNSLYEQGKKMSKESHYQPRVKKMMENRNNWPKGRRPEEHRGWSRPTSQSLSSANHMNPWANAPPNMVWSEDHWPDGQQYQGGEMFSSNYHGEQSYSGQVFSSDPQLNTYNQLSNSVLARTSEILARTVQEQQVLASLLGQRYRPPY